ncbi:hypothetical protein [Paenibacillus sp. BAC0078]
MCLSILSHGCIELIHIILKLGSNPEFTASVLVAYACAAYRLAQKGESGANRRARSKTPRERGL